MASRSTVLRASTAGGIVAVLAIAYFLGGVRSPDHVAATPTQTKDPGAVTQQDTVSVAGVGRIAGTPDTLQLQMSVESRGADVSKALAAGNSSIRRVVDSLKSHGVADADLKTSGLGVQANYNYDNNKQTLIDYVASESLTAKLRDLDKAGEAIGAAVTAGGNDVRVNGVSLDLEGNTALVQKARETAFADAKAKAAQYASLSGRELGAVSTITEQVSDSPPVPMNESAPMAAGDAKAAAVPIQRGSQEVAVHVQVVWSLK
ncbi:MAG: SIMPL domain-containing protein [Actinomycetota bacterium]